MDAEWRSRRAWIFVALICLAVVFLLGPFGLALILVFAAPAVLAMNYAGTPQRAGLMVVLGVALAAALFFAAYLLSPREQGGCSDCTELWGRWWEPGLLLYWLTLLLAAWIAGVLIGRALRR
jgi:hypothetical protein